MPREFSRGERNEFPWKSDPVYCGRLDSFPVIVWPNLDYEIVYQMNTKLILWILIKNVQEIRWKFRQSIYVI